MKKKYFLRGLGAGIVFTSVVMGVAFATLSDEAIINKAKKLGMVEQSSQEDPLENLIKGTDKSEEADDEATKSQEEAINQAEATTTADATKVAELTTTPKATKEATKKTESTKTPEATTTPKPTKEATKKTESTKTPEATTTPKPTKEATKKPESTKTPEATTTPKPTKEATKKPESTKTPEATTTPKPTKEATKKPESTKTPEPTTTPKPTTEPTGNADKYTLIIKAGMYSNNVAQILADAGMVKSATDFDNYLCRNGYDSRIKTGTFTINKGDDYATIAKRITR